MVRKWLVFGLAAAAVLLCLLSINLRFSMLENWRRDFFAEKERNKVVECYAPEEEAGVTGTATSVRPLPNRVASYPAIVGGRSVRVPVLMYHYVRPITPKLTKSQKILSVTPEDFQRQMEGLVGSGYHTVSPDELYFAVASGTSLPDKPVVITFDDGYRGQYDYAYPILSKLGLKATFFVITDYYHGKGGYLNGKMLTELDKSGLITLGSHTRHHAWLTTNNPAELLDEVLGSKLELEGILGHEVMSFAYPFGRVNAGIKKVVEDSGYRMAFSSAIGSVQSTSTLFELRRIRVKDEDSLPKLLERYGH